MLCVENDKARVLIKLKGAELSSFWNKENNTEYIWQANPAFWNRHSPVLFPIVGTLKDGSYTHKGNVYRLPRHGFARDMDFELVAKNETTAILELKSNEYTRLQFPFEFSLKIHYLLTGNSLEVKYEVSNRGSDTLFFSIGAHPAFNVPILPHLSFDDYQLQLKIQTDASFPLSRHVINEEGLQCKQAEPLLKSAHETFDMNYTLFKRDAWVFKDIQSGEVSIISKRDNGKVGVRFADFPYLGIWSRPGADFVCIEPWCGVTDAQDATGELSEKEGLIVLDVKESWSASWEVFMH